jgi:hypothetical protein
VGEVLLRVDEQAGHAGRSRGREDAVLPEIQGAGVGAREERLEIAQTQAPIRDDAVELLHEHALGQGRKLGELGPLGARPERRPVVRGALDRVADQPAEALSLVVGEPLARPAARCRSVVAWAPSVAGARGSTEVAATVVMRDSSPLEP